MYQQNIHCSKRFIKSYYSNILSNSNYPLYSVCSKCSTNKINSICKIINGKRIKNSIALGKISCHYYSKKEKFDNEKIKFQVLKKQLGQQEVHNTQNEKKSHWNKFKNIFQNIFGYDFIPNIILSITPMLIFVALYQAGSIGYWIYMHYLILNKWEWANGIVSDIKVVQTIDSNGHLQYIPTIIYQYKTKEGKAFTSDQFFFFNPINESPDLARLTIKKTLKQAKENRSINLQERLDASENFLKKFNHGTSKYENIKKRYLIDKEFLENSKDFYLVVRYNPNHKSVARVENLGKSEIYGTRTTTLWGGIIQKTILPIIAFSTLAYLSFQKANPILFKWSQLSMIIVPFSIPFGFYMSYRDNNHSFTTYTYKSKVEIETNL